MGEGERYMISVSSKSPLKTYADLKALSAKRPIKLFRHGAGGHRLCRDMIGAQLLGLKRSSSPATRARPIMSWPPFAAIPTPSSRPFNHTALRARRLPSASSPVFRDSFESTRHPRCDNARPAELDNISVERLIAAPPGMPADIQNTLSAALAKALADPIVVKWAKENDLIMKPRTPQRPPD